MAAHGGVLIHANDLEVGAAGTSTGNIVRCVYGGMAVVKGALRLLPYSNLHTMQGHAWMHAVLTYLGFQPHRSVYLWTHMDAVRPSHAHSLDDDNERSPHTLCRRVECGADKGGVFDTVLLERAAETGAVGGEKFFFCCFATPVKHKTNVIKSQIMYISSATNVRFLLDRTPLFHGEIRKACRLVRVRRRLGVGPGAAYGRGHWHRYRQQCAAEAHLRGRRSAHPASQRG